ncbi:MAG: orotidine-5'-phosphate decarboxylase [Acidobacteriota bacterium]
MAFADKVHAAQERTRSWVCLGLDPDPERIPPAFRAREDGMVAFNRAVIDATRDCVCAYKPNLAFYLTRGSKGIDILAQTIDAIPRDMPVVLDAKFGDIESSAKGYAHFAFDVLGADAVTASPYLGGDALAPFIDYADRAVFVLAHTSNPGSSIFQDASGGMEALYLRVARFAASLKSKGEVGLVVGATFPEQLRAVRAANPGAIFLIPGIGTQGGSLAEAVDFGENEQGIGPLINVSRSILYASGGDDFAEAARAAARKMMDDINRKRQNHG